MKEIDNQINNMNNIHVIILIIDFFHISSLFLFFQEAPLFLYNCIPVPFFL